ncbi:Na+/H+ antiporter NhaA [Paratractidigestivibacter faecalis]|uniref:Na(+)/H(+) antiporter NhaA n=1 Tax=Paratractidigestivibacter faecalis TaxID=2292441 RepID=A0ABV1IG98_9ACTN
MAQSIYEEPAVIKRTERRGVLHEITSNGTIAAAVMVGAALLALVVANGPAFEAVEEFLREPLEIGIGTHLIAMSVESFVNDFLMAIFFLLVGIELKYEMTVGQLRRPRQAALPMLAAVGGVCFPALIYLALNWGGQTHGWAVPIATDIAFALGVVSLLGDKISSETKVFFQTLAIADDILAIVVIALFYGQSPDVAWCAASGIVIVVLWGLNHARVYSLKPYALVGLVLWFCMYNSGIHATLAGVILAFALPSKSDVRLSDLSDWLQNRAQDLDEVYDEGLHVLGQNGFTHTAMRVERVMHHVTPPLQRMEHYISTPVNFLILPLFAFVNAQLRLVGADFGAIVMDPVTRGVFFGAVLGKPLGIISVTLLLVKIGFAKLPKNMDWVQVAAVGIMGGLGFTMSILISGLAFASASEVMAAKCAILVGSLTSAVLGIVFVRAATAGHDAPEDASAADAGAGAAPEASE